MTGGEAFLNLGPMEGQCFFCVSWFSMLYICESFFSFSVVGPEMPFLQKNKDSDWTGFFWLKAVLPSCTPVTFCAFSGCPGHCLCSKSTTETEVATQPNQQDYGRGSGAGRTLCSTRTYSVLRGPGPGVGG